MKLIKSVVTCAFVLLPAGAFASTEHGIASMYSCCNQTASGERFNPKELTAAHKTLPFGTKVRVTTREGRSVDVRINDRGPFIKGRIIDLTPVGMVRLACDGICPVAVEVLQLGDGKRVVKRRGKRHHHRRHHRRHHR